MSRSTIRTGLKTFLDPPNVAGVNTVYSELPTLIPEQAFYASGEVGATVGCVLAMHIGRSVENREALGGATSGKKRLDYDVELHLFVRHQTVQSTVTSDPTANDPAVLCADQLDTIIAALQTRIRADRTAGAAVWQWGEEDFTVDYGDPALVGGTVELWAQLDTQASEWIDS